MTPAIIHISDMHIGDWRFDRHFDTEAAARELIDAIVENEDPEHTAVVDTGDFMQHGGKSEVRRVWDVYRPLRKAGFRVMVCKGNHDTGWNGLLHESSASSAFHAFADALCRFRHAKWPMIRRWRGVLFVAANTSWDQTFLARGRIGQEQREKICDAAVWAREHDHRVVVALHHCPAGGDRTKRLSDREELERELCNAGGCDLLLSGHLHQRRIWRDRCGADVLACSPACGEKGGYRRFWWEGDKLRWEWVETG